MKQGVWTLKRLETHGRLIDTCVYQGKKYLLFLDFTDDLILVNITDRWYVYIYDFTLKFYDIIDNDSFLKLGDD